MKATEYSITINRDRDNQAVYHLAVNAIEIFIGTKQEVFALLADKEKFDKLVKEYVNE